MTPQDSPAIIIGIGLLVCIAIGYLLGETLYHVVKCCTICRNRGSGTNADTEAGVVARTQTHTETERTREETEQKLNEGKRKLNLLPLVSYNSKDNTLLSNECAICLEDFAEDDVCRVITGCNHAFHALCVDAWLEVQQRCPLCRGAI